MNCFTSIRVSTGQNSSSLHIFFPRPLVVLPSVNTRVYTAKNSQAEEERVHLKHAPNKMLVLVGYIVGTFHSFRLFFFLSFYSRGFSQLLVAGELLCKYLTEKKFVCNNFLKRGVIVGYFLRPTTSNSGKNSEFI